MRPEQWETFKRAARCEKMDKIPMALIVDSPWIPGYLGIKHLDYFLDPELWFQSNLKIKMCIRDSHMLLVLARRKHVVIHGDNHRNEHDGVIKEMQLNPWKYKLQHTIWNRLAPKVMVERCV